MTFFSGADTIILEKNLIFQNVLFLPQPQQEYETFATQPTLVDENGPYFLISPQSLAGTPNYYLVQNKHLSP